MAKGALFVGWGALIPGREQAARKVLAEAVQYLQRLQQAGTIDSFEAVALEPHGGDLAGFVLVRGDQEAIAHLRVSAEFTRVAVRVQLVHTHVGVVGAYTGAEMQSLFEVWDRQEEELTK
jgi:hypothetical protein